MTTERLDKLRSLRTADPTDADIPYMLAQELGNAGENDESLAMYDACLSLDPAYHYAYFHKARLLEKLERFDEAIGALRAGLDRARADGNAKAVSEIGQFLNLLKEQNP